jgi:hypothetical protein
MTREINTDDRFYYDVKIKELIDATTNTSLSVLNKTVILEKCDNIVNYMIKHESNVKNYNVRKWSIDEIITCERFKSNYSSINQIIRPLAPWSIEFNMFECLINFIRSQCDKNSVNQTITSFEKIVNDMIIDIDDKIKNLHNVDTMHYYIYESKMKFLYFFINKVDYVNKSIIKKFNDKMEEYMGAMKHMADQSFKIIVERFMNTLKVKKFEIDITTTTENIHDELKIIYNNVIVKIRSELYDDLKKDFQLKIENIAKQLYGNVAIKNETFALKLDTYYTCIDKFCTLISENVMKNHFNYIIYIGKSILTNDNINRHELSHKPSINPYDTYYVKHTKFYSDYSKIMYFEDYGKGRIRSKKEICEQMFRDIKYHMAITQNYYNYTMSLTDTMIDTPFSVQFTNIEIMDNDVNYKSLYPKHKFASLSSEFINSNASLKALELKYTTFMYNYLQFSDVPIEMQMVDMHPENHFSTICFSDECKVLRDFELMHAQTRDDKNMYIASKDMNMNFMKKLCKFVNYSSDIIEKHFKSDDWHDEPDRIMITTNDDPGLSEDDKIFMMGQKGNGMKYYQFDVDHSIQKIFIDKLLTCFLDKEFSISNNPLKYFNPVNDSAINKINNYDGLFK